MGAAELQHMLFRLERRPQRIVQIRCARVLDVSSEYVRDLTRGCEFDESIDTVSEGLRIAHVETPWT